MSPTSSFSPIQVQRDQRKVKDDEGNYVIKSPHLTDERVNPCVKEQNLTTKCMYENNYVRERCVLAFDNYTECKRFWKFVSWDRWLNGISPHLPPPDEREHVKREYIDRWLKKSG